MTNAQRLGLQLATPGGATMGSCGVKVDTYAGVRWTLSGNENSAKTNTADGWMGCTFKVSKAGTFTDDGYRARGPSSSRWSSFARRRAR